jgi:hypothetical protein
MIRTVIPVTVGPGDGPGVSATGFFQGLLPGPGKL